MSLSLIKVNNQIITNVDNEPTTGSENLVKSGGIAVSLGQIEQEINGLPEISQPTQQDIKSGKYLYVDGSWRELTNANYLMIDISEYKGKTLQDLNQYSNDSQYAFIVSYNDSGAIFSGYRIESKFNSALIPSDANYLYLYFGSYIVLPTLHIIEESKGLSKYVEEILDCFEDKIIENDKIITELSQGITSYLGYYCSYSSPFLKEMIGYNSYAFIVSYDCKIYTDDSNVKFLEIFNNGEISTNNYVIRLESPLPTSENPYTLTYGQLVVISIYSASTFSVKLRTEINGKELTDIVTLGPSQLTQINKQLIFNEVDNMFVSKTPTALDIYKKIGTTPYFVNFHYEHRQKDFIENQYPSFYDNWGLNSSRIVSILNRNVTAILSPLFGSEAELAINVPDGNNTNLKYVGGYEHGFDVIITDSSNDRNFRLIVDNQLIGELDTLTLQSAGKITIQSNEYLYQAYTNTNPFATAYKEIEFSDNGIFVSNKVTMLRNMDFNGAQFGMMCLWRRYQGNTSNPYLINKAIANDAPFHIYDVDDDWKESGIRGIIGTTTYDRTKITEYGELGIGFALRVVESNIKPNGGMNVWHNGGGFDKIYFDLTGSYAAQQNDVLYAKVEWEIYGNPIAV